MKIPEILLIEAERRAGSLAEVLEVVDRTGKGFQLLKRRWVVERTFAWLFNCRRLSKDYEVLTRNSATGQVQAEQPAEDPRGMGVAAMLTSELFGLRSTLDPETLGLLDQKRVLAAKQDPSEDELSKLDELNEQLGNLDFTHSTRDPLYKLFVEALMESNEYGAFQKPTLTADEIEAQKKLAAAVIEEVMKEGDAPE